MKYWVNYIANDPSVSVPCYGGEEIEASSKLEALDIFRHNFWETHKNLLLVDVDSVVSEVETKGNSFYVEVTPEERELLDISTRNHIIGLNQYASHPYCTKQVIECASGQADVLNGLRKKLGFTEIV